MKRGHSDARCSSPKVNGTLIFRRPITAPEWVLSSASASATLSSSCRQRS